MGSQSYNIYVPDNYKLVREKGYDVIFPLDEDGNNMNDTVLKGMPEVSMKILHTDAMSVEDALKKEVEKYTSVLDKASVVVGTDSLKGYSFFAQGEKDTCYTVLVFTDSKDGVFVVTQNYFTEAAEGHVARFSAMLNSFSLIK